jgi:hypothetical protein
MFLIPPLGHAHRATFFPSTKYPWRVRLGVEELDQRWLPSAATHYALTANMLAPPPGNPFLVTVRALDDSGSIDTNYLGTVHFTTTDPTAIVAPDYTFRTSDLGMATISGFVNGNNGQTITGRDTTRPSITGTLQTGTATIAGNGGSSLLGPAGVLPGTPFDLIAEIGPGTPNPNAPPYLGTIHFTSSDPLASLPDDYTFTLNDFLGDGVSSHTFHNVILNTLGAQTISATDNLNTIIRSYQTSVGTYFVVAVDNSQAGQSAAVAVHAMLAGHVQTDYLGTVHFTSSDPRASLPHDYTFKPNDAGVNQFTATFRTSGDELFQVNDVATPAYQGSQFSSVLPAPATSFMVAAPTTVSAGDSFAIKLIPIDRFNNLATAYQGTVHFASSDQGAVLPSDYTFTKGEGDHIFQVSGLRPSPRTLLRATDTADPSVSGNAFVQVTGSSPLAPLHPGRTKPALALVNLAEIEWLLAKVMEKTDWVFAQNPMTYS